MYVGKKKVSKKHSCSFSRRIFVTGCALHAPYLPSKLILNKSMYLLALIAQYTETTDWTVEKCPDFSHYYVENHGSPTHRVKWLNLKLFSDV